MVNQVINGVIRRFNWFVVIKVFNAYITDGFHKTATYCFIFIRGNCTTTYINNVKIIDRFPYGVPLFTCNLLTNLPSDKSIYSVNFRVQHWLVMTMRDFGYNHSLIIPLARYVVDCLPDFLFTLFSSLRLYVIGAGVIMIMVVPAT